MSTTIILIILTVGISLYAWSNRDKYAAWMMNPYRVKNNNEYYRFITSGFIHQDYAHLIFNMFSLYFFADFVEAYTSALFLVLLFVLGIIVSDIPTFLKHKNNPRYNSLGASGGVAAVIFSSILYNPVGGQICIFLAVCITPFIYGILYLIYSYFQAKRPGDNINHDAHLYGALFGLAFTIIHNPNVVLNFLFEIKNWKMF